MRLLLDGLFNHAGRDFPPVAQALAEGPGSAAQDWVSQLYDTGGVITADYFEGHDTLITLNHSSTRVQEYVREVMLHWLRRGIDGWRLYAAYAVPARFWAAVLPAVRKEFPDARPRCFVCRGLAETPGGIDAFGDTPTFRSTNRPSSAMTSQRQANRSGRGLA